MKAYRQAKTANIPLSIGLVEKLSSKGVLSYSLHPGTIETKLGRNPQKEDLIAFGKGPHPGNSKLAIQPET